LVSNKSISRAVPLCDSSREPYKKEIYDDDDAMMMMNDDEDDEDDDDDG